MAVIERSAWGIDTSDFRGVAKALRKAQPLLAREVARELVAGGEIVAAEARRIVAPYSATTAASIKVKRRGLTVAIEAGATGKTSTSTARELFGAGHGTRAADKRLNKIENEGAIAGLLELGNHGNSKSASATSGERFRHPVFGNKNNWVDQPMHPYLEPAAQRTLPQVEVRIIAALSMATRVIVFED